MKRMKDKVFLDSNIIIYAYSKTEFEKSKITNDLINSEDIILISTQVINEVTNILYKKFNIDSVKITKVLEELDSNFKIVNFSFSTQTKAIILKERYNLQYYDSLILATALENSCTLLYSEDMQHDQTIENQLKIINPFI